MEVTNLDHGLVIVKGVVDAIGSQHIAGSTCTANMVLVDGEELRIGGSGKINFSVRIRDHMEMTAVENITALLIDGDGSDGGGYARIVGFRTVEGKTIFDTEPYWTSAFERIFVLICFVTVLLSPFGLMGLFRFRQRGKKLSALNLLGLPALKVA